MKLPNSYYNKFSFFGTLIAALSFTLVAFLYVVTTFYEPSNPYLNILTFMIVPTGIIIGLFMIPIGMYLKLKREKKTGVVEMKWKVIDMNERSTRNGMIIFVIGTFILLFLSSIGGFEAFHAVESNEFCGTTCHEAMNPEYEAYSHTAHAKVHCVECHVGDGVEHFIHAKINGMHQVYSVLSDAVPRPIEVPIKLRPAEETCGTCHWKDKFTSDKIIVNKSFLVDSLNTMVNFVLKIKTNAGIRANSHQSGIHWHTNKDVKIEYKANEKRDTIFWVKYTNLATNETVIYSDQKKEAVSEAEMGEFEQRTMDCLDCHNRPAHNYRAPQYFVDDAILRGDIPKELIYIKQISMQVLKVEKETREAANAFIRDSINSFYQKYHPEVFNSQKALIDKSINTLIEESSKNIFPEMHVYSKHYVTHIGHKESEGCFRCHSGTFVNQDKTKTISHDCNLCHTILAQGLEGKVESANISDSLIFKHPVQVDDYKETDKIWIEEMCYKCHRELY